MKSPKSPKEKDQKKDKKKPVTLEERREEVLSQGRKFKYPLQYAKHRLVIITIFIAILAVAGSIFAGWYLLYKKQDTSDMMYRLTRVLPLSVAEVDGQKVLYSDYLLIYKSSIKPVEQQTGQLSSQEDTDNMREHYKRAALTEAENYTYAIKLAKENNIEVSDEMIDSAFDEHRKINGTERSKESFLKVIESNFGLNEKEYRRLLYLSLIKTEVSKTIDVNASAAADQVEKKIAEKKGDFVKVSEEFGDKVLYEETGGMVSSLNMDGGRATKALTLEKGKYSDKMISSNGDGYFFVKLIDKKETEVDYQSIKILFTEFDARLETIRKENKINEKITLQEESQEENQEEGQAQDLKENKNK